MNILIDINLDFMVDEEKKAVKESNTPSVSPSSCKMANMALSESSEVEELANDMATPYSFLCKAFLHISNHSGRLECILKLAKCYQAILRYHPDDLLSSIYLTLNKVAPDQEGIELGVGDAILVKAVSDGCGNSVNHVKEQYKKTGDLAEVAQLSKKGVITLCKSKPLTVRQVFSTFYDIATKAGGKEAQKFRQDYITRLLQRSVGIECNFIVRALQGKMRIGMAEQSVLAAFAYALYFEENRGYSSMNADVLQSDLNRVSEGVQRTFHLVPSLSHIIPKFLQGGLGILDTKSLSILPFVALKPMLANPENGVNGVFNRVGNRNISCEFKYDGERAQIHFVRLQEADKPSKNTPKVEIYSRNSENNTQKYPDILESIGLCIDSSVKSCILDSEVVAVDLSTGRIQSFQHLQHRGRKDVRIDNINIPVCVVLFDLIYINGRSLLELSLRARRKMLFSSGLFKEVPGKWKFVEFINTNDNVEIDDFFQRSVAFGCEGLIVKLLDEEAEYVPAKRSFSWLKLKKDYMEGLVDTLDLVPIGAYYGKGKRTGVFGGFLLACYDKETEVYQSICKLGTGFTDEQLETISTNIREIINRGPKPLYYRYDTRDEPDVWLHPSRVWEVKAADLSISPRHFAGFDKISPGKGIALRFPRFIREREDKGVSDCTDAQQVVSFFQQQVTSVMKDATTQPEKETSENFL